ncbi:hypothetical protein BDF20DRAFT_463131 [Mycotypha africana]|uniref:uncharacterized protein n=1 Tax=Mycotypha africana TaxID=64632 RepID=UPI002301441C|nr:uncharacterized protein BDF20DRAFT_463131 [Mycotypha africana]KAI8982304.1 hypothetical protein BDF20DRAFT_463131 [Mycotypha africana]
MTNSFPKRSHSFSPFRKNVDFDAATVAVENSDDITSITVSSDHKKSKRRSLRIITKSIENSKTNSISDTPSNMRARLSSLFKALSPVSTNINTPFKNSQQRNARKQHCTSGSVVSSHSNISSFSAYNCSSIERHHVHDKIEVLRDGTLSSLESAPDLISQPKSFAVYDSSSSGYDNSSFSSASDHIPASLDDGIIPTTTLIPHGFTTKEYNERKRKQEGQANFADKDTDMMNNRISINATTFSPPPLPAHRHSLSFNINQILGSALKETDEEIEKDWEKSRRLLRQSLTLPLTYNERLRL